MRTFAEFQIMGRVGQLKEVGGNLKVTVAAEYGRKDNNGDFQANAFWNEVTIFNENVAKWVRENTLPGDLVHVRGTTRITQWEDKNDGSAKYGQTFAADDFDNMSQDERRRAAKKQEG